MEIKFSISAIRSVSVLLLHAQAASSGPTSTNLPRGCTFGSVQLLSKRTEISFAKYTGVRKVRNPTRKWESTQQLVTCSRKARPHSGAALIVGDSLMDGIPDPAHLLLKA